MRLVNLGCGGNFHGSWENYDFIPVDSKVSFIDIKGRLPFDDNSVDTLYHSHVLEHLEKDSGKEFLSECYRVLKPNGILRIAVPDLETIISEYFSIITSIKNGTADDTIWEKYEWMLLELFDQGTRNISGGSMRSFFLRENLNLEFLRARIGFEADLLEKAIKLSNSEASIKKLSIKNRIKKIILSFLGFSEELHKIGKFRLGGEVHYWMYDQYFLNHTLTTIGFKDFLKQSATSSLIPAFETYLLDTTSDGIVRKPDSLFIEAIK